MKSTTILMLYESFSEFPYIFEFCFSSKHKRYFAFIQNNTMNHIRTILRHNFSLEKKYILWYTLIFVISQIGFIQIPRFLGEMVNIIETKWSYNELRVVFLTACWFVFIFDSLDNIVGAIKIKFYELLLIKKRLLYRNR